jgi:hypothetical protein
MKIRLITLAISSLALSAGAFADDSAKDEKKDAMVTVLDAAGIPRELERGDVKKPTAITSAEELAKSIPIEGVRTRLRKAVDFTKQQILFFEWSGSGGDKLTYTVKKGEKGSVVVFEYQRGLQKNLAPHLQRFAIPKDATWEVKTAR